MVLPNLLVLHELGHYVFSTNGMARKLDKRIRSELRAALIAESQIDRETMEWLVLRITWWCEELFCDLFGASLGGPGFSIAAVELFDTLHDLDGRQAGVFTEAHPSDAVRVEESVKLFYEFDWWSHFETSSSRAVQVLSKLRGNDTPSLEIDGGGGDIRILEAFFAVKSDVRHLVVDMVGEIGRWKL